MTQARKPGSVLVVGAGGHGKTVVACLQQGGWDICGVFDDDPATRETFVLGEKVVGPVSETSSHQSIPAIVAVADPAEHRALVERLRHPQWATLLDGRAYRSPSADLGAGTVVFPFAVIGAEARVGNHCVLSAHTTVGHDAVLGDYVHLAPAVQVCGEVQIGAGTMLGVGAVVAPGIRIGKGSMIGAGSVVVRDLPAGCRAFGAPAKAV